MALHTRLLHACACDEWDAALGEASRLSIAVTMGKEHPGRERQADLQSYPSDPLLFGSFFFSWAVVAVTSFGCGEN